MNNINRDINIDAIKGYAAILVVLGHTIQITVGETWDTVILSQIIYSFHMPLFMFISGWCSYSMNRNNNWNWLKRRFQSLFVPFCSWIIIDCFIHCKYDVMQIISILKKTMLMSPDQGGYWFLYTLFELCLVLFLSNIVLEKIKITEYDYILYIIIMIFMNILFWKIHLVYLGMYLLSWHSFFFFGGFLLNKYKSSLELRKYSDNFVLNIITIALAIIILPLYRRVETPTYITVFNMYFKNRYVQQIFRMVMRYIVPIVGIYASYILIMITPEIIKKALAFVGRYTIEIYILSSFFINKFTSIVYIDVIINLVISVSLSLLIAIIFERKYIRWFLFGKK